MSTGGWILAVLGILILVALFVGMTIVVVSGIDRRRRGPDAGNQSAGEILDRRFARGELTIEQYDELRAALGSGHPPRTATSEARDPANAT